MSTILTDQEFDISYKYQLNGIHVLFRPEITQCGLQDAKIQ